MLAKDNIDKNAKSTTMMTQPLLGVRHVGQISLISYQNLKTVLVIMVLNPATIPKQQ